MKTVKHNKPLVYACAGCSDVAQLSYDLAREMDRQGDAEMSCLAGLAAERKKFVREVQGRRCWIVDGCPIACTKGVFDKLGLKADKHIRLYEYGFKKYRLPENVDLKALCKRVQMR